MCKASIDHPNAPDGKDGDHLSIDTNDFGMGTAMKGPSGPNAAKTPGTSSSTSTSAACLVCLHTGAELRITEVTEGIYQVLGDDLDLVFIETPGSHNKVIHDLVHVRQHPHLGQIPFAIFAGCKATITEAPKRGEVTPEAAIGQAADKVEVTDEDPMDMLRRIARDAEPDDSSVASVTEGVLA